MPDYSRLNMKTDGNTITNIEDIKQFLTEIELDENVTAYLESLLNRVQNSTYTNKDEMSNMISAKLLEEKMKNEQQELDNKESLRKMQEYNEDLKRLNIISTSMHDNDSKKDIDYITFIRDDGTVEMLATRDARALSHFIKEHTSDITGKTAEEIFHYFKEYIYVEVEFLTPEKMNELHPERKDQAVMNNSYVEKAELEEVKKYKERYQLPYEVEIAVDQEGERLYRLGDGVIKFKSDYQGNRQMVVLQKPTMTLDNNLTQTAEVPDFQPEEVLETQIDEKMEVVDTIQNNDLTELSVEEFRRLIYQKDVENRPLTLVEETLVNDFVSMLIATMVERYESGDLDTELENTFDDYMAALMEKYEAIQDGFLPSTSMTEEEIRLCEEYIKQKDLLKAKGIKKKNEKRLELTMNDPRRQAGIGALVIILELAMVGMYILMFLSLAK